MQVARGIGTSVPEIENAVDSNAGQDSSAGWTRDVMLSKS